MIGCIWSCPTDQMLRFPVATMIRFCHNHGLIQISDRPQWYTVRGGAREYVQRMLPSIVARTDGGFSAANGIPVSPHHDFASEPQPDIVCIPDFFVNPGESVAGQYADEARWLARVHEGGSMLASACSGAVLLGETGLLDQREATIHWGYVTTLTNNYPGVKVKLDRSLVQSGEAQRIIMAGGGLHAAHPGLAIAA